MGKFLAAAAFMDFRYIPGYGDHGLSIVITSRISGIVSFNSLSAHKLRALCPHQ